MLTFINKHKCIFDEQALSDAIEWYAKLKGIVLYKKQRVIWADNQGYLGTSVGRGKTVYVHRLLMMYHLKRVLSSEELVHHPDENKLNNVLSNLELTTSPKHTSHHKRRADISDAEIMQLLRQGKSQNHIARYLGCTATVINLRVKRMREDQSYIT